MRYTTLLAIGIFLPMLGCTTMPFMPERGAGASFNLATVAYVNAADRDSLDRELPRRMDALLVEDRKRIAQLQERVIAQDTTIETLSQGVTTLSGTVTVIGEEMSSQAKTFGELAQELRDTSSRLDAAIAALPTETLRQFSRALQVYLEERDQAESQARVSSDEDPPL